MFKVTSNGKFSKAKDYLAKLQKPINISTLEKYGDEGVLALMEATPVDTGLTRASWYYRIIEEDGRIKIEFCNSHIEQEVPIAIILQYGHGTGTGGWVEGRDYINPAIGPVFDRLTDQAWKEIGE